MNKIELAAAVAKKTGMRKTDAEIVVDATIEAITETLAKGEKVQIVGFGAFETKERPGYTGHDPRTMEPIQIPALTVPSFKAGKQLKEAVSKK